MQVVYMFVAIVAGLLSALVAWWMGAPLWASILVYAGAGSIAILASAVVVVVTQAPHGQGASSPARAPRGGVGAAVARRSRPGPRRTGTSHPGRTGTSAPIARS